MIHTAYSILTSPGGREKNEDSVLAGSGPATLSVAVADGLGAHGGGSTASRAAVEKLVVFLDSLGSGLQEKMAEAVCLADQAVTACQTEDSRGMATLVALAIEDGQAVWAHVGDSRLYYFQNARLVCRTLDHSVPQMAVDMDMITQDQIRFHPDRSRILRALGSGSAEAEVAEPVQLDENFHAFLLCTDGFWEYVLEQEMEETLALSPDPQQWLMKMEQCLKQKAPEDCDNYTAAAVFAIGSFMREEMLCR